LFRAALAALVIMFPLARQQPEASMAYTWGMHVGDVPVMVEGLPPYEDVAAVQAADWGGLVITDAGDVYQWVGSSEPKAHLVQGPADAVSVGEGGAKPYGAAVTSGGQLWTWGRDPSGNLCNGETTRKSLPPALVPGIQDAEEVTGGNLHLVFLTTQGTVFACGQNAFGDLGNGTIGGYSDTPSEVEGLNDIVSVSGGDDYTLALDASGDVWAWGVNTFGQLGDGTKESSGLPVKVPLPAPATEVFAGGSVLPGSVGEDNGQSIALLANGEVWAWGNDKWGQLGNGKTELRSDTPVQVTVLPAGQTWTQVATGGSSSYALDTAGDVWAWGDDSEGQLGDGNRSPYVLEAEETQTGVSQISAVANTVVASTMSGAVRLKRAAPREHIRLG
jgi:alpha-tubulin suppressor-like RCC1 family protein